MSWKGHMVFGKRRECSPGELTSELLNRFTDFAFPKPEALRACTLLPGIPEKRAKVNLGPVCSGRYGDRCKGKGLGHAEGTPTPSRRGRSSGSDGFPIHTTAATLDTFAFYGH